MSMTKIGQVTVGAGGASTIEFASIPANFTDLLIQMSLRDASGFQEGVLLYRYNNSQSGYSMRTLGGSGSSAFSGSYTTQTSAAAGGTWGRASDLGSNENALTANTFASNSFYIPNYRSSVAKSASMETVQEANQTTVFSAINALLWNDTAAITSVSFAVRHGTGFMEHSSATLYGINRTQAIGKPKAIGGNITFANGHWVHTFTGSGTFYAQESFEAESLVVAGGGGGGWRLGGGGGAGGYRFNSAVLISAQASYAITVGAGGAAGTVITERAGNGSDSAFATIASLGGGGGGSLALSASRTGLTGGSGGGSSFNNTAGSGTPGQGFAGGIGNDLGSCNGGGGGGGGASTAGGNYTSNTGGTGGSGTTSAITGTVVARAGGGGGGAGCTNATLGAAGIGGGGTGGRDGISATAATLNTGGGGGGGGEALNGWVGAAGGSGVVIIRYPAD